MCPQPFNFLERHLPENEQLHRHVVPMDSTSARGRTRELSAYIRAPIQYEPLQTARIAHSVHHTSIFDEADRISLDSDLIHPRATTDWGLTGRTQLMGVHGEDKVKASSFGGCTFDRRESVNIFEVTCCD